MVSSSGDLAKTDQWKTATTSFSLKNSAKLLRRHVAVLYKLYTCMGTPSHRLFVPNQIVKDRMMDVLNVPNLSFLSQGNSHRGIVGVIVHL